jgi:uncharacterized damage-inducible protein DinB
MTGSMDRQTLDELFDYTTFTWASYANAVRTLPPHALTRPLDGSGWRDLREPLFHIAAGWDGWLCQRAGESFTEPHPEDLTTWSDLNDVRARTRAWLRRVIDETPDADLHARKPGTIGGDARSDFPASVADVLTHILLHERGHHGDVTTLLASLGATPPNVDYLIYRWFASRRTN